MDQQKQIVSSLHYEIKEENQIETYQEMNRTRVGFLKSINSDRKMTETWAR